VIGLGVVGIFVGQVAQSLGVAGTSASVGTIVSATIPIFIVLFATVRLKQTVTATQKTGIAAAFVGIAVVALGRGGGVDASPVGVGFMLLSSVAIAFYYVWSVELTQAFGVATVAAWSTFFGFLALLPWAGWQAMRDPFAPSMQSLAVAAYLGLVVTVAGLFSWLGILRTVPARVAAAVQFFQLRRCRRLGGHVRRSVGSLVRHRSRRCAGRSPTDPQSDMTASGPNVCTAATTSRRHTAGLNRNRSTGIVPTSDRNQSDASPPGFAAHTLARKAAASPASHFQSAKTPTRLHSTQWQAM
jgi:hypothetical protein